jgi:hypothetical protein
MSLSETMDADVGTQLRLRDARQGKSIQRAALHSLPIRQPRAKETTAADGCWLSLAEQPLLESPQGVPIPLFFKIYNFSAYKSTCTWLAG